MAAAIEAIRATYGTAENYLKQQCGFLEDEVESFKSILLCSTEVP